MNNAVQNQLENINSLGGPGSMINSPIMNNGANVMNQNKLAL